MTQFDRSINTGISYADHHDYFVLVALWRLVRMGMPDDTFEFFLASKSGYVRVDVVSGAYHDTIENF